MRIICNTIKCVCVLSCFISDVHGYQNCSILKHEIELRKNEIIIQITESNMTCFEYFYLIGKAEGFFEVIEMIELMENDNG